LATLAVSYTLVPMATLAPSLMLPSPAAFLTWVVVVVTFLGITRVSLPQVLVEVLLLASPE